MLACAYHMFGINDHTCTMLIIVTHKHVCQRYAMLHLLWAMHVITYSTHVMLLPLTLT